MGKVITVFNVFSSKFSLAMFAVTLLAGCSGLVKQQGQIQPKQTTVEVSTVEKQSISNRSSPNIAQLVIDRLLQDAEIALSRDQLMTPSHRNALDKYKAVLLFDKSNTDALLGIGKVVTRYCELAQSSASKGQFGQAKVFLARAESIEPDMSVIATTRKFIAQTQRNFTQLVTLQNPVEKKNNSEISLSRPQLQNRAQSLADELQTIALEIRETDQYVLIVAPTDADGRWVYQEMKKAVPGYRLRGDIRRGKIPKIVLEAPLQ